jgi:hypothetical protein
MLFAVWVSPRITIYLAVYTLRDFATAASAKGRRMPRLRHFHKAHFAGKELQSGEKKRRAVQPEIPRSDR